MHFRRIARLLGILMMTLAGCMSTSLIWTLLYDTMASTWAIGLRCASSPETD